MFKTSTREVAKKIALTLILATEIGTTKGHSSLTALLAMRYRVKDTSLLSVKELHTTETGVSMLTPLSFPLREKRVSSMQLMREGDLPTEKRPEVNGAGG